MKRQGKRDPIHVEIIYRGHQCPSSYYMAEAVEEVMGEYGNHIRLSKIRYMKDKNDACRFIELSVALYGKEAVQKGEKLAPVPSLFINGELIFDKIPPRYELTNAIDFFLSQGNVPSFRA